MDRIMTRESWRIGMNGRVRAKDGNWGFACADINWVWDVFHRAYPRYQPQRSTGMRLGSAACQPPGLIAIGYSTAIYRHLYCLGTSSCLFSLECAEAWLAKTPSHFKTWPTCNLINDWLETIQTACSICISPHSVPCKEASNPSSLSLFPVQP